MDSGLAGLDLAPSPPRSHRPLGVSRLLRDAVAGRDLTPLAQDLIARARRDDDPDALLDLSLVLQLKFDKDTALAAQGLALERRRLFRLRDASSATGTIRLLALKAPGDLMANTPFECLIEAADLQVDALYVDDDTSSDRTLPECDVILVAVCASDQNVGVLARIAELTARAGCRVLNRPDCVARTTRDAAYRLLGNGPGIRMAETARLDRARVANLAQGVLAPSDFIDGAYPIIVRPVGSHAGQGLAKVDDGPALSRYLDGSDAVEFYLAPFIDYRDPDGLFRKYRIVLIAGTPFLCHMGISRDWMVHYPYPEMIAYPERQQEEARLMATFDTGFAARHRAAFDAVAERTGLDYVGFDCAETRDGRLLIFEIATGMVVHDMDDPEIFPYKRPQMRRVFDAFHGMLEEAAGKTC
jgi:hypothetical protein